MILFSVLYESLHLGPSPHAHSENLVLHSCSSSPMYWDDHDHQSKCHRMLYPFDKPSWSFVRLQNNKFIRNENLRRRSVRLVSHYLKLNYWRILTGWCSLSVWKISWSYREMRTHDGFLFKRCLALPHGSLFVVILAIITQRLRSLANIFADIYTKAHFFVVMVVWNSEM